MSHLDMDLFDVFLIQFMDRKIWAYIFILCENCAVKMLSINHTKFNDNNNWTGHKIDWILSIHHLSEWHFKRDKQKEKST